jgi:single-stranded-DNA-specific exonuclease
MSKKWETLNKFEVQSSKFTIDDLITILLENRGLESKKEIEEFLHPDLSAVTPKSVGIDVEQLQKALKRISEAIDKKEQIIVFGDYDVDGITASAILWETLHEIGANCLPFIPDRKTEGYGLSLNALQNDELTEKKPKLIITVDNGIVANEAVAFANEQGIDVIVTDHHVPSDTLPDAYAIVHTTKLCGAGVAYLLSKEIKSEKLQPTEDTHLELAALGTVADLVPLTGANRAIVIEGLKKLQTTTRPGLLALFQLAKIEQESIGVYEIGYIIGPRLNASGRIASAMDSLRLLCTKSATRATELASKLESVNRERQQLLREGAEHAVAAVRTRESEVGHLLIIGHESYEEGVIGLIAGKLVEAFYRPAIVLSLGESVSKASVRSISGFNIIEFLRLYKEYFISLGGHPMAAGFSVETAKIAILQKLLEEKAEELLAEELLIRTLKIDCELSFSSLSKDLYSSIQQLAPFGMANPEPVFSTRAVSVDSFRVIGKERNHLKLVLKQENNSFEAIAFGMGELGTRLKAGDMLDIAYALDENTWNGATKLQVRIRDIIFNKQ